VRWHSHVCRVAALIHPLSSSPPRRRQTNKNSNPSCARHGARCYPRCALRHASARSLCHRAELSTPSLPPCTGLCCPRVMHGYKRDLPCVFCSRLWLRCPPVPEHQPISEQLPEAWPTSPITSEQLPEAWPTSPTTSEQLPEALPTSRPPQSSSLRRGRHPRPPEPPDTVVVHR
jgi:hypothetical protein